MVIGNHHNKEVHVALSIPSFAKNEQIEENPMKISNFLGMLEAQASSIRKTSFNPTYAVELSITMDSRKDLATAINSLAKKTGQKTLDEITKIQVGKCAALA